MSRKRRALWPQRTALLATLPPWCEAQWVGPLASSLCAGPPDAHEVRKPRERYWLNPEYVIRLCRRHHELCEAPYATGRLVITGSRSAGWDMAIVTADSKAAYRASGGETGQALDARGA